MKTYYIGDLEKDLLAITDDQLADALKSIGESIGYGRAQQILQILWAKSLKEKGISTLGALIPKPPTCEDHNFKLHPIAGHGWHCSKCGVVEFRED